MSPALLTDAPRIAAGWILDPVEGSGGLSLLLHPREPRWVLANRTGVLLARLMDGSRSEDGIVEELGRRFPSVPGEDLRMDFRDFAAELERAGMIEGGRDCLDSPDSPPLIPSLTIYLTEECNLRCRHCAIVEGRMPQTKMDGDAVATLIREHTALHPGALVSFLGGEPLLHPQWLDLVDLALKNAGRVSISTNGLLLTGETARRLAGRAVELQISLDGPDAQSHDAIRGTGTFAKTWRAIELMADAGAARQLTIATSLTRAVAHRVRELVERLDALGVGKVRFLPLSKTRAAATNWVDVGPEPEALAEAVWWLTFEASSRSGAVTEVKGGFPGFSPRPPRGRHWCPLGETFIVDSQGEAYVCPSLVTREVRAGNVLSEGLEAVEKGERAREARQWMLGRRDRVEECRRCAWRNFCQGGCLAFMGHLSGSPDRNDEFCGLRRNMYRRFALDQAGVAWSPGDLLGSPDPSPRSAEGATE